MRRLLTRRNLGRLARFARSDMLLALDFDGTLAPIVEDRRRARMRASTRRLLGRLARLYPCVVISGRARADLLRRVRGLGLAEVIGSHGIEPGHDSPALRRRVRRWKRALAPRLSALAGVEIEDKALSLAAHYRRCRRKKEARAAILAAARRLAGVRLVPGVLVLDVLPRGVPDKGEALEAVRVRLGCDTAVYVGDDETDEDVFALDAPQRLLGVRVGRTVASRARYYIRDQSEIDRLLRQLLVLSRAR